jgi:hypothetical protein
MIDAVDVAALELPHDADAARWEPLRRLAAVTALKRLPDGSYAPGHWWRGPLLYSLVQRYRPRHVLEIGTGRGYGAACMALASLDAGFECTIWTIDRLSPDTIQMWALDEGEGPAVRPLSVRAVWKSHVAAPIAARVRWLTGDSARMLRRWRHAGRPGVQLAFIDGGHDVASVRHDFMGALSIADSGCTFVFDDYTERPGYGVREVVDRDIRVKLPANAVVVEDALAWDVLADGRRAHHQLAVVRGEYLPAPAPVFFYSGAAIVAARLRLKMSRLVRAARAAAARLARRGR